MQYSSKAKKQEQEEKFDKQEEVSGKKEEKQESPFDKTYKYLSERNAWHRDRYTETLTYAQASRIIQDTMDRLHGAHLQTVAMICADYTVKILQDMAMQADLVSLIEKLEHDNDTLFETVRTLRNISIALPVDSKGRRIHPDSKIERWGAIEDFWYCNGTWKVRGHDISAPWIDCSKVTVCDDDEDMVEPEGEEDGSDPAPKQPFRPEEHSTTTEVFSAERRDITVVGIDSRESKDLLKLLFGSQGDDNRQ